MGRHTRARPATRWGALAVIGVLLSIPLLNALLARDRPGDPTQPPPSARTCPHTLRVVAASSFAPVLGALAPGLGRGTNCVRLYTTEADGRAAVGRVTDEHADLWIPDDPAWTSGVRGLAKPGSAGIGTLLATSPIYMVADRPTAARIDAAGGSWSALAALAGKPSGLRLVVRDPAGSGDGLVAVGDVGEAVWIAQNMDASAVALAGVQKYTRTVTGPNPALPTARGDVGLVPEYALLATGAVRSETLAVLGGSDHTALLRYTWLPMAAAVADADRAASLHRLLTTLTGPDGARAASAAGLRTPATVARSGVSTLDVSAFGTPPVSAPSERLPQLSAPPFPTLGEHHVGHVFATWYAADRRAKLLVVVDVSGSMAAAAPGTTIPLIQQVSQGCALLGRILPDDASLGLWEFGSRLDGPRDYVQLVAPGALTPAHRQAVAAAVGKLAARQTGTGLYATILAAYRAATDAYQPGVPNEVLVFTDGRDEDDPGAITAAELSAALASMTRPARPVRLSVVAFGSQPEVAVVKAALKPVKGYVQSVGSAPEVAAVFVHLAAGGLHQH